jgi:hypothetical protein
MIKIIKRLVTGEEVGKPGCGFFYLYTGIDTKTKAWSACIALPCQVDNNPKLDKEVRARVRFDIEKKKDENYPDNIRPKTGRIN